MNPCEIELGVATYLETVITIPANTQFLEAVNSDAMVLDRQAVVARSENVEYRGATSFVCSVEVAVRSPATVFTRAQHSDFLRTRQPCFKGAVIDQIIHRHHLARARTRQRQTDRRRPQGQYQRAVINRSAVFQHHTLRRAVDVLHGGVGENFGA